MLSSASEKVQLFVKNFSQNCNLDDSGISLPVFPSTTTLKFHNNSVTPKIAKKFITSLNSSRASSGLDCIPVLLLKTVNLDFYTY